MANSHHLAVLKQGAATWNAWRKASFGIRRPDLRNADLRDANLSFADLSNADLSNADLRDANLSFADLVNADLSNAKLRDANLVNADLRDANLSNVNLSNAKLVNAKLVNAKLVNAKLVNAKLRDADLRDADLSKAKLSFANLSNADLSNADLIEADLIEADLIDADLINADLSLANLSLANLSLANLRDAKLVNAKLIDANLRDAKLSNADLSNADLSNTNLSNTNLSNADLSNTNLSNTNLSNADLIDANLRDANLSNADLSNADLSNADLIDADLIDANLSNANLSNANLSNANLSNANLSNADLSNADLRDASLSNANLSNANLSNANLSNASLIASQALKTDFSQATLNGACIEDWNISTRTELQDVICEYIYLRYDSKNGFTDRRPHNLNRSFAAHEFVALVQKSLETVDLIFVDGIDWKAFFQSFQQLQQKYRDDNLGIQAIEKKNDAFVIRLEVSPDVDKAGVEQDSKRLYETQIKLLDAQYQEQLRLQGKTLEDARRTIRCERQEKATLLGIISTMANNQEPKYDLRGAKFGGGFATERGAQSGGTLNDFSTNIDNNLDDLVHLIQTLRQLAQTFPSSQQDEAIDHLNDLEDDLQQAPEKRKPSRIKATLAALLALSISFGGAIVTATDFTNNVLELSNKLGIELVQPQATQQPSSIDVKAIEPHP